MEIVKWIVIGLYYVLVFSTISGFINLFKKR